ncbi:MAG: DUF2283 domain-containing protein [Anaerolineae bacterium]|nr:DUF2283 domain-containing protein [Anaerolineae bacterium]
MIPYVYDYHQEADILEVFFADEEATAAVHLTPDIILHFRVEDSQATSLIFNNFSHLTQPDEYGPRAFRLEVKRWPESLRDVVWHILARPPVSEWLAVSSYRPPRVHRAIPLAAVHPVSIPATSKERAWV